MKQTDDYKEISKEEIEDYYLTISKEKSTHTVWGEILSLKLLAKHIMPERTEELFRDLKPKKPRNGRKEMPQWEDIKIILEYESNPRDKAVIMLLWDSGLRISELTALTIGDITYLEDSAVVHVRDGKTGPRDVPIIDSLPYIQRWIEYHNFKDDLKSPLFNTTRLKGNARVQVNEPLSSKAIETKLKHLQKVSGIKNPVNPHAIRKAAATRLAQLFINAELEVLMGWVPGSQVANQYYIRVSPDTLLKKKRAAAGIEEPEEQEQTDQPRKCPRCRTLNAFDAVRCSYCNLILDPRLAVELKHKEDDLQKKIEKLLNIESVMEEYIKEIKKP
ncbi:tyrosine-type recombinase/integrase [Methanochimaera problematica]|uniref:tyrosine-type recombinase/integrase n=1 Tax=Methanochimaera problematica TaxID=2609417 RepID=UPI002938DF67|nr:tyrosine-type recombinase/integrase [Methanoplanus sp. FWC-SCC4]